jgi:hypothetical protein
LTNAQRYVEQTPRFLQKDKLSLSFKRVLERKTSKFLKRLLTLISKTGRKGLLIYKENLLTAQQTVLE